MSLTPISPKTLGHTITVGVPRTRMLEILRTRMNVFVERGLLDHAVLLLAIEHPLRAISYHAGKLFAWSWNSEQYPTQLEHPWDISDGYTVPRNIRAFRGIADMLALLLDSPPLPKEVVESVCQEYRQFVGCVGLLESLRENRMNNRTDYRLSEISDVREVCENIIADFAKGNPHGTNT